MKKCRLTLATVIEEQTRSGVNFFSCSLCLSVCLSVCMCMCVLGGRKPKQDNAKSTSATGGRNNANSLEDLDNREEPTSTGLPFSATVDPLLVHVPPHSPRPPTLHECQAIVKHLYATSSQQAHEVSDRILRPPGCLAVFKRSLEDSFLYPMFLLT